MSKKPLPIYENYSAHLGSHTVYTAMSVTTEPIGHTAVSH